ncbi:MAG: bifunctional riboflavin kinase/FAD synthetase [Rhodocyclaceae bacterium]|nr:bifunctional riboflavin kinase/FAD synthetase [Rhodocyclaceae bacterium]
MRVLRGLNSPARAPAAVTIGNFDGMHRGHQALLRQLKAEAASRGLQPSVLTFAPHPREFFARKLAGSNASVPARLHTLREKLEALAAAGVAETRVCAFNEAFAALSPEDFVKQVLVDAMQAKHVLIGDDFRFGARRAGDFSLLVSLGHQYGFTVSALDSQCLADERISSSQVRAALAAGDLQRAEALLGYPYAMEGRVIQGRQLGRTIGVPTANVQIRHNPLPLRGVFVVEVALDETKLAVPQKTRRYPGIANLGYRPTLGGDSRPLLEVHLFDFAGDLYGAHLDVRFLAKLRDEMTFANFEALTRQIRDDLSQARSFFESQPV